MRMRACATHGKKFYTKKRLIGIGHIGVITLHGRPLSLNCAHLDGERDGLGGCGQSGGVDGLCDDGGGASFEQQPGSLLTIS